MAARYFIMFDNGRWATGEDVFQPPHGYKGTFNCGIAAVARRTCHNLHDEYVRAGLRPPRMTIHVQRSSPMHHNRVFFENFCPPGSDQSSASSIGCIDELSAGE